MANEILRLLNLKEKRVKGDGHCFFRCLAHQIYGINSNDEAVSPEIYQFRGEAVSYWLERLDDPYIWSVFLIKSSESSASKNIVDETDRVTAYLCNMKNGDEWADEEVIVALSNIHQIKIVIIMNDGSYIHEVGEEFERNIYVVYYPNVHYNTVEPIAFIPTVSDSLTQVCSSYSYSFFRIRL